jgi:hypothetical protein
MVFAVAALILQFASGALNAPVAAATQPITRAAEATSSITTPGPSRDASISREPNSASSTHYNFDKVSLNTASKESSTPKLSAVSLDSSTDSQTLSTVRVPEVQPGKPQEVTMAERRRYTRSWLALSLVQHGAATFDAYSTRQAISRGAKEDDPMMRPFAHSGVIYAAIQAGPVALDFIARRMQHSETGFIRRMWWVPQSMTTATFIFAGVHNLNVAGRH